MARIHVLVAAASRDLKAEIIAECVADRPEMFLVNAGYVLLSQLEPILESVPSSQPFALVLVGPPEETDPIAQRWLQKRSALVVIHVEVTDDLVRIGLRDPHLDALLAALRNLVQRVGTSKSERMARIQLGAPDSAKPSGTRLIGQAWLERPLLRAAMEWAHGRLRDAVSRMPDENGDFHGWSLTSKTLLLALDLPPDDWEDSQQPHAPHPDSDLEAALAKAKTGGEPLAVVVRELQLNSMEFRMMALAIAPELDLRFQRSIGVLLDEMGRRVGTTALYSSLLGESGRIRHELAKKDSLGKWLVFERYGGHHPSADEPLKIDPFLMHWLLGDADALLSDPRVRRVARMEPWSGSALLRREEEQATAIALLDKLRARKKGPWLLLCGEDSGGWRALLEFGAKLRSVGLLRVEPERLAGLELSDVEECAIRIARTARLMDTVPVIDLSVSGNAGAEDELVRVFLSTIAGETALAGKPGESAASADANEHSAPWATRYAAVICPDQARAVRLLGPLSLESPTELALPVEARAEAMRNAAEKAGAYLTDTTAEDIAKRYPLSVDRMEDAMRLAVTRPLDWSLSDPNLERLLNACREVASEGISHLAEQLDPVFSLDDVVLPLDRKQQLSEIVDHVRLASRVLDDWNFRAQLPYGRGVTALFCGPSGVGKTMAAMGIARQLGIQILRLDLSKIVSKYIGDTEKNLDRVFRDAQRSGSALLVDEAEAIMGKRSEVKDAHDRYANIEVAYLLQRMEAFEGLAILTTNLRQNLDPAFLRRLRFVVDFQRPDVEARRQIWRKCLPAGSHMLDEFDFRQLARTIDVTGGNISQITLRAAFAAAAAGTKIGMEHIVHGVNSEFVKLGLPSIGNALKARALS